MFVLVIEDREGNIADEFIFDEGEFTVGRSRQCQLVLPSDNVSRKHAEVFTRAGQLFVRDLGSSNGVLVDGRRIQNEECLGTPAHITIGDYNLHIAKKEDEEAAQSDDSPQQRGVHLIGMNLGVAGRHYALDNEVNLIGRGRDCSTTVIDPSVSRVHAKISWDSDGILWIEDLKSANGSYVNGIRIEKSAISESDVVRIGNVEFRVEKSTEDASIRRPRPEQTASGIRQVSGDDSKRWIQFTIGGILMALLISAIALFSSPDEPEVVEEKVAATPVEKPEEKKNTPEADETSRAALEAKGKKALDDNNWEEATKVYGLLLDKDPLSKEFTKAQQKAELEIGNALSLSTGLKSLKDDEWGDAMREFRKITAKSVYRERAEEEIKNLLVVKKRLVKDAKRACKKRRYTTCTELYDDALSIDPSDESVKKKRDAAKRKRR